MERIAMILLTTLVTATFEVTSVNRNGDVKSNPNSENTTSSRNFSKECRDIYQRVINGSNSRKNVQLLCELCFKHPPNNTCSCESNVTLCSTRPPLGPATFICNRRYEVTEAAVKVIASFLGVIGNALVLIITVHGRKEIGPFEKLIAFLAISDFTFSIMQIFDSFPLFWTCKWLYGRVMCRFIKGFLNVGAILALAVITVIASERYFAIVRRYDRSKSRISLYTSVLLCLLLSVVSVIPMVIAIDMEEDDVCVERWNDKSSLIYSWFLIIATFTIPLLVITVFYIRITQQIIKNYRSLKSVAGTHTSLSKIRYRTNRRVMLMLFIIVVAFIVLVLPSRVIWVFWSYIGTGNLSSEMYYITKYLAVFPYPFHVCVNPIIYSFVDKNFQKQILNLFCHNESNNTQEVMRCKTRTNGTTDIKISSQTLTDICEHSNKRFSS